MPPPIITKTGLSSSEAGRRLLKFGPNKIFKAEKVSFLKIISHELTEPIIVILFIIGILYAVWGNLEDVITIFLVVILVVLAEVVNEFRAKKAIASLEKIASPKTKVLRDGKICEVYSEDVVPGDVLILLPETKIAADSRVYFNAGLQIDESSLTGESVPVDKNYGEEVYAGTVVVSGEGEAEVLFTGANTRIGKTVSLLKTIKSGKTSLQNTMKVMAGRLVYIAVFLSAFITMLGILRGYNVEKMILTGLAISFVTVPEELPIVITMVLGFGAYALSRSNFFIKKLNAVEMLGNTTVIVTDKTGTITESKMKIALLCPEEGASEKDILENAVRVLSAYSQSSMELEIKNAAKEMALPIEFGEPFSRRNFSNGRKSKSTVMEYNRGFYGLFSMGAPEEIFNMCENVSREIVKELDGQTSLGRRVLAVAYKKLVKGEEIFDYKELEKNMNLAGLICFEDPPRKGVRETIGGAVRAGIKTIMVTGDHPLTARYIAREVGILKDNDKVYEGNDLESMGDIELQNAVRDGSVFARTMPEHKYRIVKALRDNGEVVAVTGDGINDVLALKSADISIAMGIRGTDVAKDAADIVLADDNYVTIAQGIFEGRKLFDNLQKGIKYYLSVKVSLILIFLIPVILGLSMPFIPIQIVILELFVDLAASTGFVAESGEKNIYFRSPRNPREKIINKEFIKDVLFRGIILFAAVNSIYFYTIYNGFTIEESRTFSFIALIVGYVALAFISRSDKDTVFSSGFFGNKVIGFWAVVAAIFLMLVIYVPVLRDMFHLVSVSVTELVISVFASACIIGIIELAKLLKRVTT